MLKAHVLTHGTLRCFPPGLTDPGGQEVNAEVSAVVFDGQRLILASDKPVPGAHRSSVFAVDVTAHGIDDQTLTYYTHELLLRTRKYEDFALTAQGDHVLATTGFDRIDLESHDLNAYNHLLIWPLGEPDRVAAVDPDPRDGVLGSLELRDKLSEAIGTPYFKIEGLAAVPGRGDDDLLLFGVREMGQAHDDFDYVSLVVGAHYRVEDDNLQLTDKLRRFYQFDPDGDPQVDHRCGLSSLEYDPHHDRLYLLTSFETENGQGDEQIGGYLWSVSLDGFYSQTPPDLVAGEDGAPMVFEHKAEGLAVLDDTRLFVAYDNDRHLGLGSIAPGEARAPCEAPYTVLAIRD
ncbi:MAG TPA: hypothetical protein VFX91_09265 [Alcanivorax sp.]|nr:hypothetical protein [Alcanivorax sp.]